VLEFVERVDWAAVASSVAALAPQELILLLALLVVRQAWNAVPLALLVPRLRFLQSWQGDLGANLVATFSPPPSDVALRYAMFTSWAVPPADGIAAASINSFIFYGVRLTCPLFAALLLIAAGGGSDQLGGALLSGAAGLLLLVGIVVALRLPGVSATMTRTAGRAARRIRPAVDPEGWVDAVERFRARTEGSVRRALLPAYGALLLMVLTDAAILLLALRFVGVDAADLATVDVVGALLAAYPLTILPLAGLGPLDAALMVAWSDGATWTADVEAAALAGLVVWRAVTLLGTLLLGGVALVVWGRRAGRGVSWRTAGPAGGRERADGPSVAGV
jgi:uncharacterized membrane protein YbhN (UPF0104 family)